MSEYMLDSIVENDKPFYFYTAAVNTPVILKNGYKVTQFYKMYKGNPKYKTDFIKNKALKSITIRGFYSPGMYYVNEEELAELLKKHLFYEGNYAYKYEYKSHGMDVIVVFEKDIEVARFSKSDLKVIESEKHKSERKKVNESLLKETIISVCKEVGLEFYDPYFYIKSRKDVSKIIKAGINLIVNEKLKKYGYELVLDDAKFWKLNTNTSIFGFEDIKMKDE